MRSATGGNGGEGMTREIEKRLAHLEQDVAVIKSNYATREDIAALRIEQQTMRTEFKGEISDVRYELLKEIHNLGLKVSGELKEFKSLLLWKIGIPFCTFLLAGMAGVIFMFLKLFTEISTK